MRRTTGEEVAATTVNHSIVINEAMKKTISIVVVSVVVQMVVCFLPSHLLPFLLAYLLYNNQFRWGIPWKGVS